MGARLAYGSRGAVTEAISSGQIPAETMIITGDSKESEMFYLDHSKTIHSVRERSKFSSLSEAHSWISKYDCRGNILSIRDGDNWVAYVVTSDNQLSPLDGGSGGSAVCVTKEELESRLEEKVDKADGARLIKDEEAEKLSSVERNAQANKIESIQFGGIPAEISNKTVNIPVATQLALGMVKGVRKENGVEVLEDGTLMVHSINIDKLTQSEGDFLILDGGSSYSMR